MHKKSSFSHHLRFQISSFLPIRGERTQAPLHWSLLERVWRISMESKLYKQEFRNEVSVLQNYRYITAHA